jgi:hypothetical protein
MVTRLAVRVRLPQRLGRPRPLDLSHLIDMMRAWPAAYEQLGVKIGKQLQCSDRMVLGHARCHQLVHVATSDSELLNGVTIPAH